MGDDGRYTHDRSDPLKALRNIRVGQTLYLTEDFTAGQVRYTIDGWGGWEGGSRCEVIRGRRFVGEDRILSFRRCHLQSMLQPIANTHCTYSTDRMSGSLSTSIAA
jgi:hypothetical protein